MRGLGLRQRDCGKRYLGADNIYGRCALAPGHAGDCGGGRCGRPYAVSRTQSTRCQMSAGHPGLCGPEDRPVASPAGDAYLESMSVGSPFNARTRIGIAPPPPRSLRFYQPTSAAAYRGSLPREGTRQYSIWAYINERPSTTDEVEQGMGGVHQSVSAAISGMWHHKHVLHPNGQQRPTAQSTPEKPSMAEVYEAGLRCCSEGMNCWACDLCLERDNTRDPALRESLRLSHPPMKMAVPMRLTLL